MSRSFWLAASETSLCPTWNTSRPTLTWPCFLPRIRPRSSPVSMMSLTMSKKMHAKPWIWWGQCQIGLKVTKLNWIGTWSCSSVRWQALPLASQESPNVMNAVMMKSRSISSRIDSVTILRSIVSTALHAWHVTSTSMPMKHLWNTSKNAINSLRRLSPSNPEAKLMSQIQVILFG